MAAYIVSSVQPGRQGRRLSKCAAASASALSAAEALEPYRFIHLYADGAWCTIGPAERMDFLRQYLLNAKPVPRVATPQYGFVHAIAFSDDPLPRNA